MRLRSAVTLSAAFLLVGASGCADDDYTTTDLSSRLVVDPSFIGIPEGFPPVQFTATIDGAPVAVTWESNDLAVATVNAAGLATPVADGFAAITATLVSNTSRKKSASFTVQPLLGTGLTSGVAVTGIGGAVGDMSLLYRIYVPAGSTQLQVALSGGTGDLDLYVQAADPPTYSDWDCRPYLGGNNETCTIASPSTGIYYIWIDVYTAGTGATLTATVTP